MQGDTGMSDATKTHPARAPATAATTLRGHPSEAPDMPAPSGPAPSPTAAGGSAAGATTASSLLTGTFWTTQRCTWLVGGSLCCVWVVAFIGFLVVWPGFDVPLSRGKDAHASLILTDMRFLGLIAAAGALGATLHAITSFTGYLGNGQFNRSWTLWYLTRAPIGATMALIFMPLVGAGLLPDDAENPETYAFTLISLGILVGMFSKDAADKLTDIFSAMLASNRDVERAGKMTVAAPKLEAAAPDALAVHADDRTLTLTGSQFLPTTTVTCNGQPRRCRTDSTTQLTAWLEPADVAQPGTLTLVARNPDGARTVDGTPLAITVRA